MLNYNDKDIIGKSIKDIEQAYSGQAELAGAKKRNLILGASLGILLVIFIVVTYLGNREPSEMADTPPEDGTTGVAAESGEPSDNWLNDLSDSEAGPDENDPYSENTDDGEEYANPEGEGEYPGDGAEQYNEVETISHLVRYEDNFWTISNLYYNTETYAENLAAFNNMGMNDTLYIGSYLRIPVDPSQM